VAEITLDTQVQSTFSNAHEFASSNII